MLKGKLISAGFGVALVALFMAPGGASALTISPGTMEYHKNPGDSFTDVLEVTNESGFPKIIYPLVENFTASEDGSGAPAFYPKDEDPYGTGLAQWITVTRYNEAITLQPKESISIPFTVNIPSDATPGGHFGVVIAADHPETQLEGPGVAVSAEIGMLLFVRVSGDIKEVGGLAEFGFKNPRAWYNYLPVEMFYRFENTGNMHLRPVGNIFVKNWMGKQVAAVELNDDFRAVLPQSIRRFETRWLRNDVHETASPWEKEWRNFGFGKYTATIVLNYGTVTNQLVSDERVFYVWPWRLLSVLGGIIVGLVLLMMVGVKLYNKALYRKFEKMQRKK